VPKLIILAVGLVFAFIGYKKTWYPSWALLFNILISVYASIMTAPQVVDKFPAVRSYLGNFSYAVFILIMATCFFVVMQLLAFRFFTAVYIVSFSKILNNVGSAVLGFLTGAVAAGFLLFLITVTPLTGNSAVRFFTQPGRAVDKADSVVLGSCNFVHALSLQPNPKAIGDQMEKILTDWGHPVTTADTAKSTVSSEPNKAEVAE
jgi:hypothetical protein